MFTAEDFIRMWPGERVRLPPALAMGIEPGDAADFLVRAGLPREIQYGRVDAPARLSFARIEHGLHQVSNALLSREAVDAGLSVPCEWTERWIIGEEQFEGGASLVWCLHSPSGYVEAIDIEVAGDEVLLVNTTVAALAASLVCLYRWTNQSRSHDLADLATQLRSHDPSAWPRSQWRIYVDYLADMAPDVPVWRLE